MPILEEEYDFEDDEQELEDDLTANDDDDDDDDPDWDRYCSIDDSVHCHLSTLSSNSLRNAGCCSACHQMNSMFDNFELNLN